MRGGTEAHIRSCPSKREHAGYIKNLNVGMRASQNQSVFSKYHFDLGRFAKCEPVMFTLTFGDYAYTHHYISLTLLARICGRKKAIVTQPTS